MAMRPVAWLIPLVLAGGCSNSSQRSAELAEPLDAAPAPGVLGVNAASLPESGFRMLSTDGSIGRFPCAVAVLRVQPAALDADQSVEPMPIRAKEAAEWNGLVDLQPYVREVVVSSRYGLPTGPLPVRRLLEQAAYMGHALCVLYGQQGDAAVDVERTGVLYDTQSRQPLAAYRAAARLDVKAEKERPTSASHEDPRLLRAEFIVARAFRTAVRDSLQELVRLDRPAATTQPSPWDGRRPNDSLPFLSGREILIIPAPQRR
jgi:hypothetical protein